MSSVTETNTSAVGKQGEMLLSVSGTGATPGKRQLRLRRVASATNLSRVLRFASVIPGWRFVPDGKHGSGTGDHRSGGKDLAVTVL